MLQLLLTVLKILGIIVLVILGIILTVLLLVLLVPIRYRGDVSFDSKPQGNVLVSWLLRLITVRVDFDGSTLKALVKVFWFRLFEQTLWPSSDSDESVDEKTADYLTVDDLEDDGFFSDVSVSEGTVESTAVEMVDPIESETTVEPMSERVTEPAPEPILQPTAELEQRPKSEPTPEPIPTTPMESTGPASGHQTTETESEPVEEKKSFLERMVEKIQSTVMNLVEKGKTLYNSLTGKYTIAQEKIAMARGFMQNPENQKTMRLIWSQAIKLIKHILPTKMNGRVKFGFDDPATTGQVLTYISPFYGVYAKSFSIEPVFDEKVMEGELHLKGRIRLGTILWRVIRVLLNKNFRVLLKKLLKRSK